MDGFNYSEPIVPSDTVNFERPTDAIYVGTAGVVQVVWGNNRAAAFTASAGQILPVRATRVNANATTATMMQALYQI